MINAEQILVDFAEGKLDIKEFKTDFLNIAPLRRTLSSYIYVNGYSDCVYNIYEYLYHETKPWINDWNNAYYSYVVWMNIVEFLKCNKIPFDSGFTKYREDYLRSTESEIQILVDCAEGKLDISAFREQFLNNVPLKNMLRLKVYNSAYKWCDYNYYDYIYGQTKPYKNDWNNINSRYHVWQTARQFLIDYKIPFDDNCTKYNDDYLYLLDIQPSWLDIADDQGIFDKILAERPEGLSKAKQIAWGKAKLKELFKYDKTYPRWVQDPEWIIEDGVPYVFSRQSKKKKNDARVYFYFYHPETKEEKVIMQLF